LSGLSGPDADASLKRFQRGREGMRTGRAEVTRPLASRACKLRFFVVHPHP
jgi:hypothetical protein